MKQIQLFTTPTAEGNPIEEYLGIVTANQVAGTGFFTDLTASLSDFFGGNSGAYRKAMNELYDEVMTQLSKKANLMGANGIVGVTIDYDSISAKNMSMFMVSVQGTAVRFKNDRVRDERISVGNVTAEYLDSQLKKKHFKRILEKEQYLKESQWNYILTNDMSDLADLLLDSYHKAKKEEAPMGFAAVCLNQFPIFVSKLPYDDAVSLMYNSKKIYKDVIRDCKLFNAAKIMELAKNDATFDDAVSLLEVDKASYNANDLADMKALADYFSNLPDIGKMEEVKGGLFSSGGLKYICRCGHKNDPNAEYCDGCNRNRKGLHRNEEVILNDFIERVETLEEILMHK